MARKNIRPLPAHIGMAAASFAQKMQNEGGVNPPRLMEMSAKLARMYEGLHIYQHHPYVAPSSHYETIWNAGGSTLYYKPSVEHRGALFLVPSLINGYEILDLCPRRSLAEYFRMRGYDIYLLDWGDLSHENASPTMDDIVQKRLLAAAGCAKKHAGTRAMFGLGYCMGGTLLCGAAAYNPNIFDAAVFLATPWDFHAGEHNLLNRVKFWAPGALPMIEERGVLSSDWVQTLFASLDPLMGVRKFARFAEMDQEGEETQIFVAVEDWLNDGFDLPRDVALECLQNWFLENTTGRGEWCIDGQATDPNVIQIPALIMASEKDRLVEFPGAKRLHSLLPQSTLITPDCGHIGMIAGRRAICEAWAPMAAWLDEQL